MPRPAIEPPRAVRLDSQEVREGSVGQAFQPDVARSLNLPVHVRLESLTYAAGQCFAIFSRKEPHAFVQLLHAVDAVFDADPAVEADACQLAEDRVVVVQAAADHAVPQPLGVADAVLFAAQIFDACLRPGSGRWRAS